MTTFLRYSCSIAFAVWFVSHLFGLRGDFWLGFFVGLVSVTFFVSEYMGHRRRQRERERAAS